MLPGEHTHRDGCRASRCVVESGGLSQGGASATILAIVSDGRHVGALRTHCTRPMRLERPDPNLDPGTRRRPGNHPPGSPTCPAGQSCRSPRCHETFEWSDHRRILVLPASANVPQVCTRASCIPMVIDTRTEMQRTAMVALARLAGAAGGSGEGAARLKRPCNGSTRICDVYRI